MTYGLFFTLIASICAGLPFVYWALTRTKRIILPGIASGIVAVVFVGFPLLFITGAVLLNCLPFQEISAKQYETLATLTRPEDATIIESMFGDGTVTSHEYSLYLRGVRDKRGKMRSSERQRKKDEAIARLTNLTSGK